MHLTGLLFGKQNCLVVLGTVENMKHVHDVGADTTKK